MKKADQSRRNNLNSLPALALAESLAGASADGREPGKEPPPKW